MKGNVIAMENATTDKLTRLQFPAIRKHYKRTRVYPIKERNRAFGMIAPFKTYISKNSGNTYYLASI